MTPHLKMNVPPRLEQRRPDVTTHVTQSIDLSNGYFGRQSGVIKELHKEMPWLFEGQAPHAGTNFPSIRAQLLNAIIAERIEATAA